MIRTKYGETRINGSKSVLLSDLSVIVNVLKEEGISEDKIRRAVDLGFMSIDEIGEEIGKKLEEQKEKLNAELADLLIKVVDELKGGKKDE